MDLRKQLRIIILALTLGGVLLVLVKVLLTTTIEKPKSEQLRSESHAIASFEDDNYIVLR
ncbi:hypothetical protein NIES37_48660 [Tolypothrix tenuis PCC 7101]|uniref:Uncharacterized protein n=1 Tax=Tolypothrix tenuis PCC 7101 TaxID=231146 RepID=A0A1Z4N570_9CYAN|nr:hypothetical protein [Aulosira sp. FACHB-113]BAZ00868.1 hypothetical protein NIES37_48660 [Tolypothrix tenuis PCC 7101]BAZ75209.1 hypothetical protein NIES50_37890 [Aulosira laxa NIES-50]